MTDAAARSPGSGTALEVTDLSVAYGEKVVLRDISFQVRPRTTLVVLGPSGCGKSSLLRAIVGLQSPASGTVRLLGRELHALQGRDLSALRREFGVAFQGSALLGSLTVGENVALPLREHTKLDNSTITVMTRIKLEQVGLGGYEDYLPSQLSGGQRKRAGIARAIAMDPKMLFLDEPSAGLDPITAAGLDELLLKLRSAMGLTTVVVTHELESAFRLADEMLMLDRGVVRMMGSPDDVRRHQDPRVRQFFDRQPDDHADVNDDYLNELTR